jgi:hypothetical protein
VTKPSWRTAAAGHSCGVKTGGGTWRHKALITRGRPDDCQEIVPTTPQGLQVAVYLPITPECLSGEQLGGEAYADSRGNGEGREGSGPKDVVSGSA